MSRTRTSRTGSIISFILSGLFVVVSVWGFVNRQQVLDQLSVWTYEPTAAIQGIQQRTGMTDKGRFIFYATQPAIENQSTFNKNCPRQEAGSPILGCYTTDDHIYIYDLTNAELDGMEEVTAAHEMLHAVWSRMSVAQRTQLGDELTATYNKLNDEELKTRMDYYQRTEPGEFTNELHSILGTEVADLGPSLESYYNQYFSRSDVLSLHAKYSSVYKKLYDRADELYKAMDDLSVSIESRSKNYDAASEKLSSDINNFNTRADNGSFTSNTQFYQERSALIARSNALEAERVAINDAIDQYNAYHAEYTKISDQIEVLNQSIDSFKQIDKTPSV